MDFEEQLEKMQAANELKWSFLPQQKKFNLVPPHQDLLDNLPPGAYEFGMSMFGPFADIVDLKQEELISFDEGPGKLVMEEVDRFWDLKERYAKLGVPYRRGIMMHGPPGTGKSGVVRLVCNDVIEKGGLVAIVKHAETFSNFIPLLNRSDPNKRLVVVLEDVDNLVNYDEHEFLQLLDGLADDRPQMLFLATTNFIQHIPARIYRPSRFDLLVEVGLPCAMVRHGYVEQLCQRFGAEFNQQFVDLSEGLSFAHLKELIVSHLLFERSVEEIVERLKKHGDLGTDDEDDE